MLQCFMLISEKALISNAVNDKCAIITKLVQFHAHLNIGNMNAYYQGHSSIITKLVQFHAHLNIGNMNAYYQGHS